MKIVSTTLAGPDALSVGLEYALESVAPHVDECLVIATDSANASIVFDEAVRVVGAKAFVGFRKWPGDFSDARNFALDLARQRGADWAITVDDDERIEAHGEDVRSFLSAHTGSGVLSLDEDETYGKARAIRCLAGLKWVGVTHESIVLDSPESLHTFPRLRFSEVPKSPEQLRSKFTRDAVLLSVAVEHDPKCTRSWYYLGASLHGTGDLDGAIQAFRKCASLHGWHEESAWACYRAASLLVYLERYDEALEACAAGLRRDAGMAELPTLAATACLRMGDTEQARCWAMLAQVHSQRGDQTATRRRLSFRDPPLLRDGGASVLEAIAAKNS